MSGDVKPRTVDEMTKRIRENHPRVSGEKARQIAVDSARRINRRRSEGK